MANFTKIKYDMMYRCRQRHEIVEQGNIKVTLGPGNMRKTLEKATIEILGSVPMIFHACSIINGDGGKLGIADFAGLTRKHSILEVEEGRLGG